MNDDARTRAAALLSEILQEEITPDGEDVIRQEHPEWDSINHFRLISELEDTFGLVLDDDRALAIGSLDEVAALIREHRVISGGGAAL